jgi:predicted dehydrogenase
MEDRPSRSDISRREFFRKTGTAAAAAGVGLSAARKVMAAAPAVGSRVLGANDRLNVGVIGVKGMGGGHINYILKQMPDANVQITAICDVWEKARLKAKETIGLGDDQVYNEHERMLERDDLDVVIVATPDHTHSLIGVDVLESGRHLYVEKPMTRYLKEAFKIKEAAEKSGKLVQLGAQGCTEPQWQKAKEVIKEGRLGKLLWAQGSYCRNNPNGEWNYEIDPEAGPSTVDWKRWLGPAKKVDWDPEYYFRWRKYWAYGTGLIGDLLPHRLAPLMMAMGLDEYPHQVSCFGGNLLDTDKGPDPETGKPYGARREVADTHTALVEFPSGVMLFLATTTSNERGVEDIVRGNEANLVLGGSKVLLEPERPYVDEIDREDFELEGTEGEGAWMRNHANHVRNFFDSIRGTDEQHCPLELACQVQAVVSCLEKSYREGKTVRYDARRNKMRT